MENTYIGIPLGFWYSSVSRESFILLKIKISTEFKGIDYNGLGYGFGISTFIYTHINFNGNRRQLDCFHFTLFSHLIQT